MKTPEELEEIKQKASVIAAEMFQELAKGLQAKLAPFAEQPIEERLGNLIAAYEYANSITTMLADSIHGSPVYNQAHAYRMHEEACRELATIERKHRDRLRETGLFEAVPELGEEVQRSRKEADFLNALSQDQKINAPGKKGGPLS